MANYTINQVGNPAMTIPSKAKTGDTWTFNITNSDPETAYTGTILRCAIPVDCRVKIEAYGARGSYGNLYTYGVTETSRSGNGAYVHGEFDFAGGDELLLLVGQHGRDAMTATVSTSDLITGAGGGGSFVVKRAAAATGYTMVGNALNGSDIYAGWHLTPLLIAAGGNGTRDNGYSSLGTIYGGKHTTGTAPTYASYAGGGFAGAYGTVSSNSSTYSYGLSFLYGGLGSQYYYTRSNYYAKAGFGGGGSNRDDGAGGGGGGYYGGLQAASAQSYNAGENADGISDHNVGDGLIRITFLSVPGGRMHVRQDGKWRESADIYVKQNGLWKPATGIYAKQNGQWKEGV